MPNGVNNQFSRLNPTYRNRAQYNRVTNANPSGSTTMGSGIPQKATSIFRGPIPNVPTSAIQENLSRLPTVGSRFPQKATSIFRGPIPNVPTSAIQGILASPEYDPSPVAVAVSYTHLRAHET